MSPEEQPVEAEIKHIAKELEYRLFFWSVVDGYVSWKRGTDYLNGFLLFSCQPTSTQALSFSYQSLVRMTSTEVAGQSTATLLKKARGKTKES